MENNKLVKKQPEVIQGVLNLVESDKLQKAIVIPPDYSPENALKSAYFMLQDIKDKNGKPVLESCDPKSINHALYNMVVQGLTPAKNQCYFIPYGNKLTLSRSYLGTIAVTKRMAGVKDVKAYCVFEGDKFEYSFNLEKGLIEITSFEPKLENIDIKKIKAVFCLIYGDEGVIHTEIMTMNQIQASWNQGSMKGNSGAHKNFTEEMAMKSVINRACKRYYGTSSDSSIMMVDDEPRNIIQDAQEFVEEANLAEKPVIDVQSSVEETPEEKTTKKNSKKSSEPTKEAENQVSMETSQEDDDEVAPPWA